MLRVVSEHREAVEYDLLDRNLRLRWLWDADDDRLTWRDLLVLVHEWLSREPDSHTARAARGEDWPWGMQEHLLAAAVDATRLQTWSLGGGRSNDKPDPIERPGVTAGAKDILTASGSVGGIQGGGLDKDTLQDPRDWLGW